MAMYADAAQFAALRLASCADHNSLAYSSCMSLAIPCTPSDYTALKCGPLRQWSFHMPKEAVEALLEDGKACWMAVVLRQILLVLLAIGLLCTRLKCVA
jgi:hypothetical protein